MVQSQISKLQEDNDLKKISDLFIRNYRLFIICIIIAVVLAFLINRYSIPVYNISSSVLIKENKTQQSTAEVNDFLNSSLFGKNQNFQNELWVLKSSPVLSQTIRNLDLLGYLLQKKRFHYHDAYQNVPFQVFFLHNHPQPVNVRFEITFLANGYFQLKAKSGKTAFYNFETEQITHQKDNWNFIKNERFGELIETNDLSFIIKSDSTNKVFDRKGQSYGFEFKTVASLSNEIKNNLSFNVVDKLATVIEISLKSESLKKGIDIVNELMNVYSEQNLGTQESYCHRYH